MDHPYFGRPVMCHCLIDRLESYKLAELRRLSSLDRYQDKTFKSFDPKVDGVDLAYQEARRFARDPQGWMLLRGSRGCGKTHLAAAIAHHTLDQRTRVLFTVVPELLDHLRATFGPNSEVKYDELFDSVRTTNLLILDDLGTENATPWVQEKLFQLFNYRYDYRLPMVVTTNRPLTTLDERIVSRLLDKELCRDIEIKAKDYREREKHQRRRR